MKNRCRTLILAAAVLAAACSSRAVMDVTVAQAPSSEIVIKQLDINVYKLLDTVKTDASGRFRYRVDLKEGQPEFIYLFRGDTRIASLLLSAGDRVSVTADTLGNFTVVGSPESEKLRDNELAYTRFIAAMDKEDDPRKVYAMFVDHYRGSVRYVMENPTSLTVVPVLLEQLDAYTPVFCQYSDAIIFRKACDTLRTAYPDSRYVKALENETARRENVLKMHFMVENAGTMPYPELDLPDVNGRRTALSSIGAKAVLLHFWDSSDATHKMFNVERLLPHWKKWHPLGFEIYAVDLNPDKAAWASVVKAQELPWINVNDGRGGASPAAMLYNVATVPASFLLAEGGISASEFVGEDSLDKELKRILK